MRLTKYVVIKLGRIEKYIKTFRRNRTNKLRNYKRTLLSFQGSAVENNCISLAALSGRAFERNDALLSPATRGIPGRKNGLHYVPLKNLSASVYSSFSGKPHFSTISSSLALLHMAATDGTRTRAPRFAKAVFGHTHTQRRERLEETGLRYQSRRTPPTTIRWRGNSGALHSSTYARAYAAIFIRPYSSPRGPSRRRPVTLSNDHSIR